VTPRIRPLDRDEISPDLLELPAFRRSGTPVPFNIYRTLAHHPAVLDSWILFGDRIRYEGDLSAHDRELLILRTGANCECEYEWGQHAPIGLANGITEAELVALTHPLREHLWGRADLALLSAADELHRDAAISDRTWAALSELFSVRQTIEITMLIGMYHVVCFVLNGFRVEREPQLPPFPGVPTPG
jgi:4-carboxymuconolactone decarboxylase